MSVTHPLDRRANQSLGLQSLSTCLVRTVSRSDWPDVKRLSNEGLLPGDRNEYAWEFSKTEARFLGKTVKKLWVAKISGAIVGTISLAELNRDTAQMRGLRVATPWQADHIVARLLVRTAVEHVHQVGFLKLIFDVPLEAEARVVSFLHPLGFQFSKHQLLGGRSKLEFFIDLYHRTNPTTPKELSQATESWR